MGDVSIKGYVEHIVFRNEENGYTVFELNSEGEEITCVGNFQAMDQGEILRLTGTMIEHSSYGEQLKVESYETLEPQDVVSIERYLGSGAVKGVGPALAGRIVKRFGEETFRIMEQEPERLAEIKGISEQKARELAVQIEEKKELRQAMIFLQRYGISNSLAVKIYDRYGMRVYTVLRENPYQMAEDIDGIGFKIADAIASRVGIHTDSDYRIRSGILYTLLQASADGHTYLPEEELVASTAELLGLEGELLLPHLSNLMMDKKIVIREQEEKRRIYAASLYYLELNCARMLFQLRETFPGDPEAKRKLLKLEEKSKIRLQELQRKAVLEAVGNGVLIVTGGPGTGKTTTINMIIRYFEAEGMDFLLAAPTGRAAKRMTEATGYEARTIHRLLEITGMPGEGDGKNVFERNEGNPLEADVVIIDEMSMVDIHLFYALLRAVAPGTRLILVGDRDQLPSVGPGAVLKDLLDSGHFPVVMLQKIFRQAVSSDIVVNAHKINAGQRLSLDNKSRDFFFLERGDARVILGGVVYLVKDKLPPYVGVGPQDIQVITPTRKGVLGVENLNKVLQQYLNPPSAGKAEKEHREGVFRVGDKVMQIKNNYQLEWEVASSHGVVVDKGTGIYNGDMGIIRKINDFAETLEVEYDEHRRVTYTYKQLEELELSYAITIHKSQGSEYPAVVIPLLSGPRMLLNRNLLYTGVTRAKSCVTIIGSGETLTRMIENETEQKRYASLAERIREIFDADPEEE